MQHLNQIIPPVMWFVLAGITTIIGLLAYNAERNKLVPAQYQLCLYGPLRDGDTSLEKDKDDPLAAKIDFWSTPPEHFLRVLSEKYDPVSCAFKMKYHGQWYWAVYYIDQRNEPFPSKSSKH